MFSAHAGQLATLDAAYKLYASTERYNFLRYHIYIYRFSMLNVHFTKFITELKFRFIERIFF